jgi:hypothetical protein
MLIMAPSCSDPPLAPVAARGVDTTELDGASTEDDVQHLCLTP